MAGNNPVFELHQLFDDNPMIMTISTMKDARYVRVNAAFEKATGYCKTEVEGKTIADVRLFADPKELERAWQVVMVGGSFTNFEAKFRTKTGGIIVGLLSAQTIQYEGEVCVLTIAEDVTERIRNEEVLRERIHELETINQKMLTHQMELEEKIKTMSP